LRFGRKSARPAFLTTIFTILDSLTVNIREFEMTKEERQKAQYLTVKLTIPPKGDAKEFVKTRPFKLAKFIVDFWRKVRKFVRNLKREMIYAQSEGTIRY
jgi:hypothetical protein